MTDLRTAAQQALERLRKYHYGNGFIEDAECIAALEAALAQQAEPVEHNIADEMLKMLEEVSLTDPVLADKIIYKIDAALPALRAALAQEQAEPLTIERLRDALVASRIIPPAAVEDPDEYDDGVTLHRIEALHRRIA